jgi:hypothetical protein
MNRRNVVSVQPALEASYHPPAPIRTLGSLLIPPHSVARKALDVCQGAFMDAAEALRRSREADAQHDTALVIADNLAARGVQLAAVHGCPCVARYKALRRAIRTAQAADEREDSLIGAALVICRRLTAAIEKLFARRARGS